MKSIGVAVLGGSGFGTGELLRLLFQHNEVELTQVISTSSPGVKISEAHPQLLGFYDFAFEENFDAARLSAYQQKFIFCALPHGIAATALSKLRDTCIKSSIKVIDLSGDFRLRDSKLRQHFYPESIVSAEFQSAWQYGLSELFFENIANAQFVSNPGCLATAATLALAPLASLEIESAIHVVAATGSSGAGRELKQSTHHPLRSSSVSNYKTLCHQHQPEIEQTLKPLFAKTLDLMFVPQSLPVSRGIFVTAQLTLERAPTHAELLQIYRDFYRAAPFVRMRAAESVELNNVIGSNFCDVALSVSGKKLVISAAIDNLVKGMAGQAIQNMNIMAGLEMSQGLMFPGLRLV